MLLFSTLLRKFPSSRALLCIGVGLAGGGQLWGLETDPVDVDASPAIVVGDFELSQYQVAKNFNRFVADCRAKRGAPPSEKEVAAWFRIFIAQTALKARLVREGVAARPAVRDAVARMERQILIQAGEALGLAAERGGDISPEELRARRDRAGRIFDVKIVRFDDEAIVERVLGPEERARAGRLEGLRGDLEGREMTVHEGPIEWPFHPFEEIAGDMAAAPRGCWMGPLKRDLGIYYLRVSGEMRRPQPTFEEVREAFEKQERDVGRWLQRRVRHRAILRKCEFALEAAAVAEFSRRYLSGELSGSAGKPGSVLARYVCEGRPRVIAGGDFVEEQRRRLIRFAIRSREDVEAALERMVVEEVDYKAACAAGVDRELKFCEDRRNFELIQVLARYEEEVLAPRVAIAPAELDAALKARRREFPADAPEEQVVNAVERELRRERLDAVVLEEFLRSGDVGRVELRIDFSRYGIGNPFGGTSAAMPRRGSLRICSVACANLHGRSKEKRKHKTQTPQKQ